MPHSDVTPEILRNHIAYGASDYNNSSNYGASKSLNYAKGPSISRPDNQHCTVVPHTFKYEGDIGLFGTENYFTKIRVAAPGDVVTVCYEAFGWECAMFGERVIEETGYDLAVVNESLCPEGTTDLDGYNCANTLGNNLPYIQEGGFLSVELKNMGVNNQFIDKWLDVRLYTDQREEHEYNKMYVRQFSDFYVGIHARNTKRLPFKVACVIGVEYISYESIEDKNMIMKSQRP